MRTSRTASDANANALVVGDGLDRATGRVSGAPAFVSVFEPGDPIESTIDALSLETGAVDATGGTVEGAGRRPNLSMTVGDLRETALGDRNVISYDGRLHVGDEQDRLLYPVA